MLKYAAFLRGVNLGRHRRVSGAELRQCFEEMGFQEVQTFRTSGNVVFSAKRESDTKLADRIEKALAESLGYHVAIFLRSRSEIRAIADHHPFSHAVTEASRGKLQVMMLSRYSAKRVREGVLALATDDDMLAFGSRELYWLPSGGTQNSALDMKAIEALLGSTTMRTKGTIEQMTAKYFAG